jgi:hypothetical protein
MAASPATPPDSNLTRLWRLFQQPWFLVLVAALLRFGVAATLLTYSPPRWGVNEAAGIARELVLGHGFSSPFHDSTGPTAWLAPIYPCLLACVFRLFGIQTVTSAWVAVFLNVIFGSLTSVVVLKLGCEFFGKRAGVIAGWAWAVSPPVVVMPWLLWETSLSALVMSLVLLRTLRLNPNSHFRQWIFCGCVWSFAALLNPALLAPLPVLALLVARRRGCRTRTIIMLLVCALGIAPWTIRNFVSLDHLVLVRSNFWPEAYFGNVTFSLHPTGDSMLYQREGEIPFARDLRARVLEHVRSHVAEFAGRTLKRSFDFWTQPANFGPYATILFLAALAGIVLSRRARREWLSFASVLALYPLVYYLTYTFARYRHPIEPVMYALAGYALSELARYSKWASLRMTHERLSASGSGRE